MAATLGISDVKIVQFGLCYSPNLGDGIIAECIAYGITTRAPQAEVSHVDLSARRNRGEVVVRNREALLAVLDRLPLFLRHALVRWKMKRLLDGVADAWDKAAEADLAVIGGGQIFSDANLNFPLKIGRAAQVLARKRTPCAVYAVGVSRNWTPQGRALFRALESTQLQMVGVRDAGSLAAWAAQMPATQMPTTPKPEITVDPGLLAAGCYGAIDPKAATIGLCITDFTLLAHHADGDVAGQGAGGLAFYTSIVLAAVAGGQSVTLFCNGATEDLDLLKRLTKAPELDPLLRAGQVLAPAQPQTPTQLARIIGGCSAVIAHRLHACIVAYSYQRPVVGLGWDSKLQSFFDLAGMSAFFSSAPDLTGPQIVEMALAAIKAQVPAQDPAHLVDAAWDGIDRLLACVPQETR